jgi:undecaprenyl-diphosphatase
MDIIVDLDRDLFLYLNNLHTAWLDPIMLWITKTIAWLPLYLFLLFLIIKNYKKQSWIPLLGIAITILLADQITSGFMKPFFERLRPSREPSLEGLVHLVDGYTGGLYGFASSHAANTLGTAIFFFLLFRAKYAWIKWLFLWATLMTYTRIYLGVHYPGDIVVGALIGLACGWGGYSLVKIIKKKIEIRNGQLPADS